MRGFLFDGLLFHSVYIDHPQDGSNRRKREGLFQDCQSDTAAASLYVRLSNRVCC